MPIPALIVRPLLFEKTLRNIQMHAVETTVAPSHHQMILSQSSRFRRLDEFKEVTGASTLDVEDAKIDLVVTNSLEAGCRDGRSAESMAKEGKGEEITIVAAELVTDSMVALGTEDARMEAVGLEALRMEAAWPAEDVETEDDGAEAMVTEGDGKEDDDIGADEELVAKSAVGLGAKPLPSTL
ncbi:hypothetical protein BC829DRAFT_440677 [Chytridium lagenaria]|nr:hypothetical protein BC829DRAFT_440677 [Chytridium lagenaria]